MAPTPSGAPGYLLLDEVAESLVRLAGCHRERSSTPVGIAGDRIAPDVDPQLPDSLAPLALGSPHGSQR